MRSISEIQSLIEQGENGAVEFKRADVRPESLAREITAFSNTNGGSILVGVDDNGTVIGIDSRKNIEEWTANVVRNNVVPATRQEISLCMFGGKQLLIIEVPRGPDKPYQTIDGKFWVRVGSTNRMATKEELSRLFQQAGLVHYDIAPLEGTQRADLDERKLHDYWSDYYNIDYLALEEVDRRRLLLNADILLNREDEDQVSVGGLLLFGREPQRRLPQSAIVFAVFDGVELIDDLLDKQEIVGTLPELIRQTKVKIRTFLPRPATFSGLQREERPAVSDNVIREAVVNAVCHRDYSIANRKTAVYIFRDRLEIISPGRLPNTLTVEKILTGNSAPRNHFLLKYLDNMKFIDGLGRGVPMMRREMGERLRYQEEGEILRLLLDFETPLV
ncbi:MAG: putative DNA binding domain-containing protein [Candidatus Electrothrix communis]|nr:MAG: putative DNA binding domain-containing protein [Candidatus Electrothrix communis]